jgi:hypothetical protein
MHDVAILGVAAQNVGDYLTKSLREKSLVYVLDGIMHIFFGSGHSAHHVSLVAHNGYKSLFMDTKIRISEQNIKYYLKFFKNGGRNRGNVQLCSALYAEVQR